MIQVIEKTCGRILLKFIPWLQQKSFLSQSQSEKKELEGETGGLGHKNNSIPPICNQN